MTPFLLTDSATAPATTLEPGPMLLEASAGTGKTYTIAGLVVRLVLEHDLALERIAVMTFTIAATAELRDRIRAALAEVGTCLANPDATPPADSVAAWLLMTWHKLPTKEQADWQRRIRRAVAGVDAAPIATIHGFARRLALDHAATVGLDPAAETTVDLSAWRREQAQDWFRIHLSAAQIEVTAHLKTGMLAVLEQAAASVEHHPLAELSTAPVTVDAIARQLVQRQADWKDLRGRIEAAMPGRLNKLARNDIAHPDKLVERLAIMDRVMSGAPVDHAERKKLADLWDEVRLHKWQDKAGWDPALFLALADLIPDAAADRAGLAAAFIAWYTEQLHNRHRHARELHVSDALLGLDRALKGSDGQALAEAIGARYDAVLVDEFQDTDLLQWHILYRVFGAAPHRLVLIGDPKQAIYAFRGADVYAYAQASSQVAAHRRFTLATNWRSDAPLVDALNALYLGPDGTSPVPDAFALATVSYHAVTAAKSCRFHPGSLPPNPLQILSLPGEMNKGEATHCTVERVCDEVCRLLDPDTGARIHQKNVSDATGRPVMPGDIAILVRTHKEADQLHRALARLGIAALRQDKRSVFDTDAASELQALLAACLDPVSEARMRSAAGTRLLGFPAAELIAEPPSVALRGLPLRLAELGDVLRWRGVTAWWYQLTDVAIGHGTPRLRLARLGDGGRMVMDVLHLIELLAAEDALPVEALPAWLGRQRAEAAEEDAPEASQRRLERDDAAVRIMTVHVSKGLQFPIVIEAFSWAGCRPVSAPLLIHPHDGELAIRHLTKPTGDIKTQAEREALGDALRKLYVGLTRAEHRLLVIWATVKAHSEAPGSTTSALAWLLGGRAVAPGLAHPEGPYAAVKAACADLPQIDDEADSAVVEIEVEVEAESDAAAVTATPPPILPQRADPPARHPQRTWTRSSFSGLSQRLERAESAAGDGHEHDHDQTITSDRNAIRDPDEAPSSAALGTLVHALYELGDWNAWRSDPTVVETQLVHGARREGLSLTPPQVTSLAACVRRAVIQPVPGLDVALADIPALAVAREWPVRLGLIHEAHSLATVFAGRCPMAPDWPHRLQPLGLKTGVFTGILDALVVVDGRHHVVDWKSNRLDAYDQPALWQAMTASHYILQAHLYLLAVHRFLRVRLADYRPEQHLGSAAYVFVRGTRDDDPAAGWAIIPHDLVILERLDACCA